jgi:alpha-glucosidase
VSRRRVVRLSASAAVAAIVTAGLAAPTGASAEVTSGSLRATVTEDPWHLALTDAAGAPVLDENTDTGLGPTGTLGFSTAAGWFHATGVASSVMAGDAFEANLDTTDPTGRGIHVRLEPDGEGVIRLTASVIGETADVTATGIGFDSVPTERFLGFGERSNSVDQRGNEVEDYVSDGPYIPDDRGLISLFIPPQGFHPRDDATYFPVPWLLSTSGYGALVGNDETSYFRLGSSDPSAWSVEAQSTSLDLRFMGGPTPADALERLTEITGRQPAPAAPWIFGPWYQPTGSDQLAQARGLRAADVPGSAVNTFLHYLPCGDQRGVEGQQPGITSGFHDQGYAITTYFNPMICTRYQPTYSQAASAGVLTRDQLDQPYVYRLSTGPLIFTPVSQFDFTAPETAAFWRGLLSEAVDHGYDGWMEDFGEYTPLDAKSADGTPGDRMHNLYPTLYHCATFDYTRTAPRALAPFIRSGWTGTQGCAEIVWGGDPTTEWGYDGLTSAITQALSLGTSGISRWGSDIGGFFTLLGEGRLTPELLSRWIELGAVSGVMRTEANGVKLDPTPRPQIFDPEILPIWRRYAKLRTQLFPYLVAADAEYRRTGMPLMRHLALTHPDDPLAIAREDEFMFGPDFLAAPVHEEGETSRELYLPGGEWVDFWEAVSYEEEQGSLDLGPVHLLAGGRSVSVPAPLEQLPLMVRAGAVLPLLPPNVDTLASYGSDPSDGEDEIVRLDEIGKRLHLLAFPRGESSSPFGESGLFDSRETEEGWELTMSGAKGYKIELEASLSTMEKPLGPCQVLLDGHPLGRGRWSVENEVLTARFVANREVNRLTALDQGLCR